MGGSISKDASLTVGIDGVDDVANAAQKALGPWESMGQRAGNAMRSLGSAVGQAAGQMLQDLGRVAMAVNAIDMTSLASKYVGYTDTITRQSLMSGESVEKLKNRFKDLQQKTGLPDAEIQRFALSLQRATYDAGDSSKAMEALNAEALRTGKTLAEMQPLETFLHDGMNVSFDGTKKALADISAEAKKAGESTRQVQDNMQALGSLATKVNFGSPQALASLAGRLGHGLSPEMQREVQQRIIGRATANPEGMRRDLGMTHDQFYDKQGRVKVDGEFVKKLWANAVKRWGKRALEVMSQDQNYGSVGAQAIKDFAEHGGADMTSQAPKELSADEAKKQWDASEAGRRARERAAKEAANRDSIGKNMAGVQDAVNEHTSSGWLGVVEQQAGALGINAAGRMLATRAAKLGGKALVAGEAGEGAAAGGSMLSTIGSAIMSPAGALVAAGAAGVGAGMLANKYLNADDHLSHALGWLTGQKSAADYAGQAETIKLQRGLKPGSQSFVAEMERKGVPHDQAVALAKDAAAHNTTPIVDTKAIAAAVKDGMKDAQIVVQLQDDTNHPIRVAQGSRGASQ